MLQATQWGYNSDTLPPVGSSPDGLIYHHPCTVCCAGSSDNAGSKGCAQCLGSMMLPGQWEVVEVKNHCPFMRGVRAILPIPVICIQSPLNNLAPFSL
jgi:hypothetical protein